MDLKTDLEQLKAYRDAIEALPTFMVNRVDRKARELALVAEEIRETEKLMRAAGISVPDSN
ncbi:hypothetical protein D3C83_186780 [compost metagenome]